MSLSCGTRPAGASCAFTVRSLDLSLCAGQTVRIRFSAGDFAVDNLLEAAVDDVRIVVQ